ncbi:condensation domain-containing protein, partial [Myxococcus sp. RHSTA-1-4]|uniref:condensation domain-containing protein n=1 Tax=Myxococcus sp. RHSTA-1-4 TaxID=2874601 RepID=UPI001CBC8EE1
SGDGLARGYVRRPDLTAERFLPNPFSSIPGARMYRTGDLARWRQDGVLEFLGRRDFQVKVRGFRIELAEVEAALLAFSGVREAVALAREDVPGDKRLVGYVTGDASLDMAALRAHLQGRLPEYMVPSALLRLDSFPLTANAKVDRKALPAPDSRAELRPFVAPSTPTEQQLAALWAEVLRVDKVGIHDDFFELGGHSLLATQVVSRVRKTFEVELPLRALFEAPTLVRLAPRIEEARRQRTSVSLPPLLPAPRSGSLPLSFAQQRLWFLDQLQPGSVQYNMPITLLLEGVLDIEALESAFTELVRRHESLRTTFSAEEGQPVQLIHPPSAVHLVVVDLTGLPEAQRMDEAHRLASEHALRPFNLATGPLLCVSLLRLDEHRHALLLNVHHIISDGWSSGVLVREVAALYEALRQGQPSPLPPLPVQYADYALWQRQWLQGPVLEAQLGWWMEQLAGAPPHLELPTDFVRPPELSHRGATVPVSLPRELSEALKALAQREGATPFMLLLASFQLLLSRYSGQEDVVVGSPIAGRRFSELESLIGFFINTLALRTRLDDNPSFRTLLGRVKEMTLGAYAHQDVPFEKLVEELQPVRDLSRSPLFQVLFALQNIPTQDMHLPSLSLRQMAAHGGDVAKFELNLSLFETPEGFRGTLQFHADLFTEATAARMVRHLQVLLEAIVSQPDQRLSELPLLTPSERQQVLVDWNTTTSSVPADSCFHHAFELQVARTPDAPAVQCEDSVLTYAQLDARANQLAWHLRSLGVGPETCVALCLDRSVDTLVALLGVWKAGGAYVPLDPAQPALRLQSLVDEVSAPAVVTVSQHAASFASSQARTVLLDTGAGLLDGQRTDAPPRNVSGENVAYVLFTSGSTGRPKGVAVAHAQLIHYVRAATERLRLADCSSFALVSTFVADLGNTVLFPALFTGGLLHVLTQERASSPAGVAEYFQRHPVDCVKIVPSHLAALLTAAEPQHVLPRKKLVLGGEPSTWPLMGQVRALAPKCEVFNHYGPTETTVGVLAGRVEQPAEALAPAMVPLGRPLAHTRLYVLDERLRPLPVG